MCIDSVLRLDDIKSSVSSTLWAKLAVLTLLCNHPLPFLEKLDSRRSRSDNGATDSKAKSTAGYSILNSRPTNLSFVKYREDLFRGVVLSAAVIESQPGQCAMSNEH